MKFLNVVPLDAILTIKTGMDGCGEDISHVSHDQALVMANKWNEGGYHCDMWMNIYYQDYSIELECFMLTDSGETHNIVSFLYGYGFGED